MTFFAAATAALADFIDAIAASADFMDATLQSIEHRVAPAGADQFVVSTVLDEASTV